MSDSKQTISFYKMQGAGNDFVVIDNRTLGFTEEEIIALTPSICDRKYGVGSDGILALAEPKAKEVDYTMIYRNPDGSNAGMCGNGARCIALFAHSLGFDANHTFNVHDQMYEAEITGNNTVVISFPMESSVEERSIDGQSIYQVHTGTEHIVLPLHGDQLEQEEMLQNKGATLRHHDQFQPVGTNVNFISGQTPTSLKLQTFERGVENLTLACGTGAIASALVWHHQQQKKRHTNRFEVQTKGGKLTVHFSFDPTSQTYSQIKLEGPAHFVFKGQYLH